MTIPDKDLHADGPPPIHQEGLFKKVRELLPALPSITRLPISPDRIIPELGVERKEQLGNWVSNGIFFLSGFTKSQAVWCGEVTRRSTHAMLWALAQATGADPTLQLERLLAPLQCYLWPATVDPHPGKRGLF